jgi:hypothetical protein
MKRPKQRAEKFVGKPKELLVAPNLDQLEAAANGAKYAPSNYHCKLNGRIAARVKPATPCPRDFTLQEAGDAIRLPIRAGRVSKQWVNGFPRYIWHRVGTQWYEACSGEGTAGTYHAYPIDDVSLPPRLQRR